MSKIYNEDFQVGQRFFGLMSRSVWTVVDIRESVVEHPMVSPLGVSYVDNVKAKTIYFKDETGRVFETGYEDAKRRMLQRIDDKMAGKMAGFERVYPLVEKARMAEPVDTETLEDIRDTYGRGLYVEALDAVFANHSEELYRRIHRRDMLDDVRFAMRKYVVENSFGDIRLLESDGGRFLLDCGGKQAEVVFDLDQDEYVYTVNGKGPFEHSSYEFIMGDIRSVLQSEIAKESSVVDDLIEDATQRSCSAQDKGYRGIRLAKGPFGVARMHGPAGPEDKGEELANS